MGFNDFLSLRLIVLQGRRAFPSMFLSDPRLLKGYGSEERFNSSCCHHTEAVVSQRLTRKL